jgi:hypothetical protein
MATLEPVSAIPSRTGKRRPNPNAVPKWARALVSDVCRTYDVTEPEIRWRKRAVGHFTSGRTNLVRIAITAGSNPIDSRHVLLHELAHWIVAFKAKKSLGHSIVFWNQAWELYGLWEQDLQYTLWRESSYREKARDAAPMQAYDEASSVWLK